MTGCLRVAAQLLDDKFGGQIDSDQFDQLNNSTASLKKGKISLTTLKHVLVDVSYVESFGIPDNDVKSEHQSIVTIYKTNIEILELMKKIGINASRSQIMSETTILLSSPEIMVLKEKAPYLIAMSVKNKFKQSYNKIVESSSLSPKTIADPQNEPTIGVIDTLFDKSVYFSKWVEFHKMFDEQIPLNPK